MVRYHWWVNGPHKIMVSYWCVYWPWQNYHVKAFTWVTDLHRMIKAGCSQDLHKMIKVRHSCVLTKWSLLSTPLPGISIIRWITSSGLKWPATILAQRSNTCWKLGNLFLLFFTWLTSFMIPKHNENSSVCEQASSSSTMSLIMWSGFPGLPRLLL